MCTISSARMRPSASRSRSWKALRRQASHSSRWFRWNSRLRHHHHHHQHSSSTHVGHSSKTTAQLAVALVNRSPPTTCAVRAGKICLQRVVVQSRRHSHVHCCRLTKANSVHMLSPAGLPERLTNALAPGLPMALVAPGKAAAAGLPEQQRSWKSVKRIAKQFSELFISQENCHLASKGNALRLRKCVRKLNWDLQPCAPCVQPAGCAPSRREARSYSLANTTAPVRCSG